MADEATATPEATEAAQKPRSLVTKAQKAAAKADVKKAKKGDSTRVNVPTAVHFAALDEEIAKVQKRAFKSFKTDDFIELRALYDRGYRWARKLYENEELLAQSKAATKAAQKAEKEAADAAQATPAE